MSEEKPPKPPADQLAKELKASLAQRRPRPWKLVLGLIVACSLILAGMMWWLYPRGRTAPLLIVAFDGVFTPAEMPIARGQLLSPTSEDAALSLRGYTIVFDDQLTRQEIAKSDAKGQAALDWPIENAAVSAFSVQFINPERKQSSAKEYGRLFVWPKDARVLVVDADETLIADELDDKAQETLSKAAQDGWHIVYLVLKPTSGHDFRRTRGWLDDKVKLPKGPILGHPHYPSEELVESVRHDVLQSLKATFQGEMIAVVKSAEAAATCKEVNVRAIRIGDAATATWADVQLK